MVESVREGDNEEKSIIEIRACIVFLINCDEDEEGGYMYVIYGLLHL